MTEPTVGRWTGSINNSARRMVRGELRRNAAAAAVRRPTLHRWLRGIFAMRTFWRFLGAYVVLNLVLVMVELFATRVPVEAIPAWIPDARFPADASGIVLNVSGFMIAAQVGALGVISIALALVTIIAQRDSFSTDVHVYYHESMAFEVIASCLALLVVLCAQLLWPLQHLLHYRVDSRDAQLFKLILLGVHTLWLVANLAALAHFARTTLRFVQQSSRQAMRKQYTAAVSAPREMVSRVRAALYQAAGQLVTRNVDTVGSGGVPYDIVFGRSFMEGAGGVEISSRFRKKVALRDVRIAWVAWVVRRWAKRVQDHLQTAPAPPTRAWRDGPRLTFALGLDQPVHGVSDWCRRSGDIPLQPIERAVLRLAFRFSAVDDEH
ncbi:hypothetical protein [Pseudoxanthomonas mexicana]